MKQSVLCASLLAGASLPLLVGPALGQSGRLAGPRDTPALAAADVAAAPALATKAAAWTKPSGPYFAAAPAQPPNFLYRALGEPENWRISGSFRPRVEGIANQFRPVPTFAANDILNSYLTTLHVEYGVKGPVRMGVELFDSRGYFQQRNSSAFTTEINALEPGQAYLNFDTGDVGGDGSKSSLTVGRFTKNIGSRRLVSRQQFRNTINAYTGVTFDWQGANRDKFTALWVMPHTRLPDDVNGILDNGIEFDRESLNLQLFGASYTFADILGGTFELYGYGLYEQDSGTGLRSVQTRDRRLFTPGLRLARRPQVGAFDYDFEAIYQTGLARETASAADLRDLTVSAYFVHAEVGYTFDHEWKPRLSLHYDHASGDRNNDGKFTRFDTLFGARRFEYGPTGLYGPVQRANLISPSIRAEITPSKVWDAFIAYRPLWLESATDTFAATLIRDRTGRSGTFAGHQIEGRLRYWIIPNEMILDTGLAYLAKGDFLRNAPNAPDTGDTFYGYFNTTVFF
ncbi:alginate export family protein [Methylobacterium sp. DM1]|nr:alginate export family protein [Methylobacterium sp. DM1]